MLNYPSVVLCNKPIYRIDFANIGFEKHQKGIPKYRNIDIDNNIDRYRSEMLLFGLHIGNFVDFEP